MRGFAGLPQALWTLALWTLLLPAPPATPATPSASDRAAIEATIAHYFRAGDTNSSAELKRAFHPAAMMFFVKDGGLTGVSQPEWWARIDAAKDPVKALSRKIPLVDVDVAANAAVAKVLSEYPTHRFEDYMSLLRVGGEWRIVGKIFHRTVPPNAPAPEAAAVSADAEAIRAVLQTLFAAMDANDGALAASVASPRAVSYTLLEDQLVGVSLPEWQARLEARKAAAAPAPKASRRVVFVDSEGGAAVARLEHELPNETWIDYASLLRVGGKWTIVGLVSGKGAAS
jgi:Putative lumazine-binding